MSSWPTHELVNSFSTTFKSPPHITLVGTSRYKSNFFLPGPLVRKRINAFHSPRFLPCVTCWSQCLDRDKAYIFNGRSIMIEFHQTRNKITWRSVQSRSLFWINKIDLSDEFRLGSITDKCDSFASYGSHSFACSSHASVLLSSRPSHFKRK